MNKNLITKRILTYNDLIKIPLGDNNEAIVDVKEYSPSIVARYNKPDMLPFIGKTILVREAVARKLALINTTLERDYRLRLKVVYGYRHPSVQQKYFNTRKTDLHRETPDLSDDQLMRLTHNFVAVPEIAGHPTGGAVDLTIVNREGDELDMGTQIADYSDSAKIKTFFRGLTEEQRINRKLLHDCMVAQGFAPFYGEWWHFSWGDREWAAFYGQAKSLYSPIHLQL